MFSFRSYGYSVYEETIPTAKRINPTRLGGRAPWQIDFRGVHRPSAPVDRRRRQNATLLDPDANAAGFTRA